MTSFFNGIPAIWASPRVKSILQTISPINWRLLIGELLGIFIEDNGTNMFNRISLSNKCLLANLLSMQFNIRSYSIPLALS